MKTQELQKTTSKGTNMRSRVTFAVGAIVGATMLLSPSRANAIACKDMYGVRNATLRFNGMFYLCRGYDIEHPLPPQTAANAAQHDLHYRWVPLCVNGTGDHEWTTNKGGTAPSCPESEYIRSIDGTRPMYYVDRARTPDGNEDQLSNNWVFWFQGGGTCSDNNTSGKSAGEICYDLYTDPAERNEMGTAGNKSSIGGSGIMNARRDENRFKTYNRVRIKKSSYDRFTGTATLQNAQNNSGDTFNMYWHGRHIVDAVIHDLAGGITFEDENGDNTLPPLSNADLVIFSGHSGGAGGLVMNGDWLAEQIRGLRPAAKVRLVFDARWKPGLENEAGFDQTLSVAINDANGDGVLDAYDHISPHPNNPGQLPNGYTYSNWKTIVGGDIRSQQDQLGVALDESCEALHGSGSSVCRDERHVLMNHISTPYFIRQALMDSNNRNNPTDHAEDPGFKFSHDEFRERVVYQLNRFVEGFRTLSDLALTAPFLPAWSFGIFATYSTVHAGISSDEQFFGYKDGIKLCEMGVGNRSGAEISCHDALYDWVTFDQEVIAIQDPTSVGGEYCDAKDPTCDCWSIGNKLPW